MKKRRLLFVSLSSYDTLKNSLHKDILENLGNSFDSIYVLCYGQKFKISFGKICFFSGDFLDWITYAFNFRKLSYIYITDFFIGGFFGVFLSFFFSANLVFRCGSPWKYPKKSLMVFLKIILLQFTRPFVIFNCKRIVYNSKSIVVKWPKHKYFVSYNFVDVNLFSPKKNLVSNKKVLRVLFIGRVRYEKGITYLCKAVASLGNKASLTVVGSGPLLNFLSLKYPEVSFLGRIEHKKLVSVILDHDVVILPSLWESSESFPNVLIESMACAKPVIGTNVWGIPEMIDNGENGILIEPKNVLQIINSLNFFIENKTEISRMGKLARKKVVKKYNKSLQIHHLYKSLFGFDLKK